MQRALISFTLVILFLSSCGSPVQPAPTIDVAAIQTSTYKTAIAQLTLNAPTNTPKPTNTPAPTRTPVPTFTSTPAPEPIILTGNGDQIVDFQKWDGAAILHVKYAGGSNFVVRNYPANSSKYTDLLVNVIGAYEGTVPLDLLENDPKTARFEVIASGSWELQVLPFNRIRKEVIPKVITGTGDEVFIFSGAGKKPDLLKTDASLASSNIVVMAYHATGRDLLVNEIAPYTGTTIMDPTSFLIVINATGPWSLEITTK